MEAITSTIIVISARFVVTKLSGSQYFANRYRTAFGSMSTMNTIDAASTILTAFLKGIVK